MNINVCPYIPYQAMNMDQIHPMRVLGKHPFLVKWGVRLWCLIFVMSSCAKDDDQTMEPGKLAGMDDNRAWSGNCASTLPALRDKPMAIPWLSPCNA